MRPVFVIAFCWFVGLLGAGAQEASPVTLNVLTFDSRYNNPGDGINAWPNRQGADAPARGFCGDIHGSDHWLVVSRLVVP